MLTAVLFASVSAQTVNAAHSWGNYHWARKTNPFTIQLGSNVSSSWRPILATASTDWSASSVLDTVVIPSTKNPKTCKPTLGRAEVCNAYYGRTGWLGLAQIWINGSSHITQGTVKLNDTYMNLAPYNTIAEKNHVMCQEVGHIFGLGHQDESGAALGTCMDYSMDTGSQHPNAHDYQQLEQIYAHLDSTSTVGASSTTTASREEADMNSQRNWGRKVFRSQSGYVEIYERSYRDGSKIISAVYLPYHH